MTTHKVPGKRLGALAAFAISVACLAAPASARDGYVQDDAKLFSAGTVANLNQSIGDFNRQTGKEVVVVSVPSLGGETAQAATEKAFAQQQVNGVLIFLAKTEQKQGILGDRASRAFFPNGSFDSVRQAMRGYFRTGDFDTGITTGVNLILSQYRGHERALPGASQTRRVNTPVRSSQSFGGGMSLFFLILVLLAGFMIIRAVFRAMSGPRRMPPGYGGPGYGPGQGPGYGAPGYGPGMGGGMGGGGFFSGLLGGLGGAFLGNELFGRQNQGNFGGDNAGIVGGDSGSQDAGGWQSDAGQADTSNASFGDFGSSGGGFDGGGGGFDAGGGGGGDSGGGW